jgi:tRNA 2-thiouridine synthesizing protein A
MEEKYEKLDCLGLYCPVPVLQLREKMDSLPVGAVLEVLVDDPAAEEDFIRWAKRTEQQILKFEKKGTIMRFLIKKMV